MKAKVTIQLLILIDSISASNYYGARHGIETLFQTIVQDEVSGRDSIGISKLPY